MLNDGHPGHHLLQISMESSHKHCKSLSESLLRSQPSRRFMWKKRVILVIFFNWEIIQGELVQIYWPCGHDRCFTEGHSWTSLSVLWNYQVPCVLAAVQIGTWCKLATYFEKIALTLSSAGPLLYFNKIYQVESESERKPKVKVPDDLIYWGCIFVCCCCCLI